MIGAALRRLPARPLGRTPLLRSSAGVALGLAVARLLGFGFFVVAGRTLSGADFGRMAYALNLAAIAAVLVTTSPLGLSRYLAEHRGDAHLRREYYANWLAVVLAVLVVSGIATAPVAAHLGIGGWLLAGVVVNLAGVAALETYREVQRGVGRFARASGFFVAANLLQLVVIAIAAAAGHASAALDVTAYGASGVVTLVVVTWALPSGLSLSPRLVSATRAREVLRFVRPMLLHSIFYNVCFSADLLAVSRMLGSGAAGSYAAAETLAGGLLVVPMAAGFTYLPRVPHLARTELWPSLVRTLAAVTAVTAASVAFLALWGHLVLRVVFGARYPEAARPLAVLAVGMGLYGLCSVLGSLWLGLGRPVYSTVATGLGMVAMLATLPVAVSHLGIEGGAWGFTAGAAVQLLVMATVTVARLHRTRGSAGDEAAATPPPPIAVVSDALDGPPDEGYTKVTRELTRAFGAGRAVIAVSLPASPSRPRAVAALVRLLRPPVAVHRERLRQRGVRVVLYASRAGCTLPALVRARLLRAALPGARVVILALQPRPLGRLQGAMARRLWPDLVLAGTDSDRDRLRGAGARAESVWGGVDLDTFRPPAPGERAALRRAWGLPAGDALVLHVGHLTRGRNLEALLPLTGIPGVRVVVALSTREDPGCAPIRARLVEHGVIVLSGYLENIAELYRLADCYAFPTESTDNAIAMPLSVIEALASGLPVATTRLGALPERFEGRAAVRFVDAADRLRDAVLDQLANRPAARPLAEPFAWQAQARRVLDLLEAPAPHAGRVGSLLPRVVLARARRGLWAVDDAIRALLFGSRAGFERRPTPDERVVVVERGRAAVQPSPVARTGRIGLADAGGHGGTLSLAAEAAELFGLEPVAAGGREATALVRRATEQRWPLVIVDAGEDLDPGQDGLGDALAGFVTRGGSALVVAPAAPRHGGVHALLAPLGIAAPATRPLPSPARGLRFSAADPALTAEFTGTELDTDDATHFVDGAAGAHVVAAVTTADGAYPAVVEYGAGAGRVLVAVAPGGTPAALRDLPVPRHALRVLPAMMLMRSLYGDLAWRPPTSLAGFVVDDPALRCGWLGLSRAVIAQLPEWEFHVTVATIPRELELADPTTVSLLAQHPTRVSACYHGNNHSGYEFYLPGARRERFRARSLEAQRRAVEQAVRRGRTFWERTGLALDRVMVFPHGIGPVETLSALQTAGFLATCNFDDRDPLGTAGPPADPFLGLRPADTAWSSLPLLQRRGLPDHGFVFDLFVGRPAISFSHDLHDDLEPVRSRARQIATLHGDPVQWRSLEDIARHAYLQRRTPEGDWEVLMAANEICLHNPSWQTRTVRVHRPHLQHDRSLAGGDGSGQCGEGLTVVIEPGATSTVTVVGGAVTMLPARGLRCSLAVPSAPE